MTARAGLAGALTALAAVGAAAQEPPLCAPLLEPGTMMMFPGQTVHFVSVYRGARPRITLSWNLNHESVAGDPIPYQVNRIS